MKRYIVRCIVLSVFLGWPSILLSQNNSPNSKNEYLNKIQEMKQRIMKEFFSDSSTWMNNIDDNLFRSFGLGADLSGSLFKSRWSEEKDGQVFLITPEKKSELKIVVSDGFISIDCSEKSDRGISSSKFTLSVPENLDWKQHKITKKNDDIAVFFPYYPEAKKIKSTISSPQILDNNGQKTKSLNSKDDEMIPIVPADDYDVI